MIKGPRLVVVTVAVAMCVLGTLADQAAPLAGAATRISPADAGLAAFKRSIRRLYDMKQRSWAAGDVESIVTRFYAPDAISVGAGEPNVLVGREQFRVAYRRYLGDIASVHIESVRTFVNANAGWDWANFYFMPKPDKARDYPPSPIRILFLWSKRHGQWVCEGEMFVNGKFRNPL